MKKVSYKLKSFLLTIFGDIKVFRWPLFIAYQPTSFKIKGPETRSIMSLIEPGDVIMRSYSSYLDGYFIPKGESQCSHSGLYIGENQVIHSIAEGSKTDDSIDFCRTDKIIILRPAEGQPLAIEHALKCADSNVPYDFNFESGSGRYYCHEFTASCYPTLNIKPLSGKILNLFDSPEAFLADSFYKNSHFEKVY